MHGKCHGCRAAVFNEYGYPATFVREGGREEDCVNKNFLSPPGGFGKIVWNRCEFKTMVDGSKTKSRKKRFLKQDKWKITVFDLPILERKFSIFLREKIF